MHVSRHSLQNRNIHTSAHGANSISISNEPPMNKIGLVCVPRFRVWMRAFIMYAYAI